MKCKCGSDLEFGCPICHDFVPVLNWVRFREKPPEDKQFCAFIGFEKGLPFGCQFCLAGRFNRKKMVFDCHDGEYDIEFVTHYFPLPEVEDKD
jgi:hypothetical protein